MVSCLYTNKSSSSYSLSSHTFKQGGVVNISECTLVIAQRLLASNTFSWQAHAGEPEASVLPHPHISRTAGLHWFPTESIKQHNVKKDGFDLNLLIALLAAIVLAGLIWLAWHFYWTKKNHHCNSKLSNDCSRDDARGFTWHWSIAGSRWCCLRAWGPYLCHLPCWLWSWVEVLTAV